MGHVAAVSLHDRKFGITCRPVRPFDYDLGKVTVNVVPLSTDELT